MQILLIMLIVIFLAFSVLLLALAKQSPREKQTEDKEQEEYIRDYAETVRQTGGSMKKLEHWKVIAIYLIIYGVIVGGVPCKIIGKFDDYKKRIEFIDNM